MLLLLRFRSSKFDKSQIEVGTLFYLAFFFAVIVAVISLRPIIHLIPPGWFIAIFILAIFFAFFKGLGLLPTLSGYIEQVIKMIDVVGKRVEGNIADKSRKRLKSFLLKSLDLLVVLYLVNAIRKLLKIALEVEIVPLALTLDWFDVIFMSALITLIGAFLIINNLHTRGISHLWKSSAEEVRAQGRGRHLVLILGIIGTLSYFIITISTWEQFLSVPNYISIGCGAVIYMENRFKGRWRLRVLLYIMIGSSLIGTYVGAEQYGIIGGSIIAILFALGFLFIWWEALRRTLWLSKAFEFPGHSVKEKTCLPLYGVLLLPDQLQALKNIFNVEREQIERILRRLEIKIERRKIMNLDLSDKGLSTLPESIENLKILKELHLSNNDLSTLPQSITRLTSLEVLHLSNNDMKTFPESLKKLK